MYSYCLHATSIVCRLSIRSNNGSNHTIPAGLHSMRPVESIHQSITWGQARARFSAVAATLFRVPLLRSCALVWFFSINAGSCDDLLDDDGLGIGIILDILPFLLGQSDLSACVQIAIGGIASQPVSEHQHAVDFGAAGREYVQVNFGARSVEHPVFEPVGLPDTKHVAGGYQILSMHLHPPNRLPPRACQ